MARLALAVAYDGTRFESYARQPGRRTVEGEIVRLLERAGFLEDARSARFRSGSRTDAHVSAAWNIVAFDTDAPPGAVVAQTVHAPDGLHFLSALEVDATFEPRHARRRHYRYQLSAPWPWRRLRPVAKLFEGEHDFTNFRRADGDKPPLARIERVRYDPKGPSVAFVAPSFLWQQVRRMVHALQRVADGDLAAAELRDALDRPSRRVDLGIAPPEGLLLERVDYHGLRFPPMPAVARARVERERADAWRRLAWARAVPIDRRVTTKGS